MWITKAWLPAIWTRVGLLLLLLTAGSAASQGAEDFHELFERRCAACHGHAGDFAREALVIVGGELRGRKSGRPVRAFLATHRGGLDGERAALFTEVLFRQVESGGLFQAHCAICHVRARDLVQARLVVTDGRLMGRYSGADMGDFLRGHGRAADEEAQRLYEALLGIAQGRR